MRLVYWRSTRPFEKIRILLVIFQRYNNLPAAHVEFATLEAGGFHPAFQNQHHAVLCGLYFNAFGGLIITVPASEYAAAKAFLADMQAAKIIRAEDIDKIPERRFGKWKTGTVFSFSYGFVLPFFLLPFWLQILGYVIFWAWMTVFWTGEFSLEIWPYGIYALSLLIIPLVMSCIIFHAKHYAAPKLRDNIISTSE